MPAKHTAKRHKQLCANVYANSIIVAQSPSTRAKRTHTHSLARALSHPRCTIRGKQLAHSNGSQPTAADATASASVAAYSRIRCTRCGAISQSPWQCNLLLGYKFAGIGNARNACYMFSYFIRLRGLCTSVACVRTLVPRPPDEGVVLRERGGRRTERGES